MSNKIKSTGKTSVYLSICVAAALSQSHTAMAQDSSSTSAVNDPGLEELVVTGYRKSLQDSTNFKKDSIGFADGVFAEDMGKFPDTNVAESLNRIPGVTISREITGEGVNVSIRGLGTNFVKVLLNNAPIAVASTGPTDQSNTNREVDLDVLPTEFFTQLTVSKTPDASTLEGGSSGTVNMRSLRAFDNPGLHATYSGQATKESTADGVGERGSFLISNTFGNFGVLAGISGQKNKVEVKGFETIGWANYNLSVPSTTTNPPVTTATAQCLLSTCNPTGGGNPSIPGTVPVGAGAGLVAGDVINQQYLLDHNPGLTISQIDNAIFPRLGRPTDEFGNRERVNAVLGLEYKPTDNLYMYVDSMFGRKHNDMQRIDMNFVGRNGATIPVNMKVNDPSCLNGCVVTSATFANSQFFLEFRPYIEDTTFFNVNPGLEWKISDKLKWDIQANRSYSHFERQSPSVVVSTPTGANVAVDYVNNGDIPTFSSSLDLNNPANFGWNNGSRVNLQDELRWTSTKGVRTDLTFGGKELSLEVGAAFDDISRQIRAVDNTGAWQPAVCGGNPNIVLPAPNSQPNCVGSGAGVQPSGYSTTPVYPALGTNYSQGMTGPVTWAGSLIPQASVPNYLLPGPAGFVTVDWKKFANDTNYYAFNSSAPMVGASNTAANQGFVREKSTGVYFELNGDTTIDSNRLKYSVGVRWVRTNQTIKGQVTGTDPRNPPDGKDPTVHATFLASDGGRYPNFNNFDATTDSTYNNALPSVEVAYYASENAVFKAAASKTMTRPNPNTMLPGLNFSDISAASATLGNPALKPYSTENLDFGFEYYTGKEGYVGIEAFRKRLTNFPQSVTTNVPFSFFAPYGINASSVSSIQLAALTTNGGGNPDNAIVQLTQQTNVPGSAQIVNGIEFNWVQPLDFIGMKGFGFTANYTIVDQQGIGAGVPPIVGVPPHTFNLTGYYEDHGISVRMSEVYNYGYQAAVPPQNGITQAGLFTDTYRQWDFSSSFDLAKLFGWSRAPEITFDVQNVFDASQRSYFQFPNATFTKYDAGRFFLLGVRQKF